MATMSIMGLYNYDETIFDDMILPDGVNRENFITELLLQLAELEVVYANPDVMKTAIKAWSVSRLHEWNRVYTALTFDYNALYNKEGKITETINTTGTNNATVTNSGNNTETITNQASGSSSGSNIHSVSAYNETGFQNAEKDEQSAESSSSGSQSVQGTNGSTQTTQGSNGSMQSRTLEEAGNIGVTMSQDMLKAEIGVRSEYDITHIIIDEFKRRFCILVY